MTSSQEAGAKPSRNELGLRLLSAAVLIPFAVLIVWAGGAVCAAACAFFGALMAYEWVRMTHSPDMKYMTILAAIAPLAAYFFGVMGGLVALGACTLMAAALHPLAREKFKAGFGLFYASGMPLALFIFRDHEDWAGRSAALLLMVVVWISDSGAYFTGKTLGGPPLSSVSPSKTWSGAGGGIVWSALGGICIAYGVGGNPLTWAIAGVAVSIVAQAGDLFESILKRRLGVKDASSLVPGHGGIMDRVDGLGAAAVLGVICFLLFPDLAPSLDLL